MSLLRVMATIARTTTSNRVAAMSMAAVGLSPKTVVRSCTTERGSAEAPSSLFMVLLELVVERSVLVTLPDELVSAAGASLLAPGAGAGAVALLDEELDFDWSAGAAGADEVALEDELDPGWLP